MKQIMKKVASFSSMLLLMMFSFGLHLNILPSTTIHAMEGMNQSTISLTSCAAMCNIATIREEHYNSERENNKDDEPRDPSHSLLETNALSALEKQHSEETRFALSREPPLGRPPAYILFAVFRA